MLTFKLSGNNLEYTTLNFFNQTSTVFITRTKLMAILFIVFLFSIFLFKQNPFVLGELITKFLTMSTSNFFIIVYCYCGEWLQNHAVQYFLFFKCFPQFKVIYESYINAQGRWYIRTSEPMHFLFIWILSSSCFWILSCFPWVRYEISIS